MAAKNTNNTCPSLIEVALPVREISAESVRDKSLRHGHISTLHLWWARRPLAASRAVVFASLVPDPDDPRCPEEFRRAVERYLKTEIPEELKGYWRGRNWVRDEDPYRPYLPAEASAQAGDGVPDTLRNRLLTFIAKWSPEALDFERGKRPKPPKPKELLDDRSLVKWETSDPENQQGNVVLKIAQELIRIAHSGQVPIVLDPFAGGGAIPLEAGRLGCKPVANDYNPVAYLILRATCEFPQKYGRLGMGDRRLGKEDSNEDSKLSGSGSVAESHEPCSENIQNYRKVSKEGDIWAEFSNSKSSGLDSRKHCGGMGTEFYKRIHSISEDSKRLGLRTGDTSNAITEDRLHRPEPPEGTPGANRDLREDAARIDSLFGEKEVGPQSPISNPLLADVEKWAKWILERAKEKIGHLYPHGKDGRPVVGYLWARTAPCSNPSCRGEIPLLRSLLVCNKKGKKIALTMNVDKEQKTVWFGIARGKEISRTDGTTVSRGAKCPFCDQITHVDVIKEASFNGHLGERIVAVIVEGKNGKDYRPVEDPDIQAFEKATELVDPLQAPNEPMPDSPDLVSGRGWNFKTWGSLFNPRQLVAMQTFVQALHEALDKMKEEVSDEEYRKAVGIYLGLWVSRSAPRFSNVETWWSGDESFHHPFTRQAIPMAWDYGEPNPFNENTGGVLSQLDWIKRVIIHESDSTFSSGVLCGEGAQLQIAGHSIDSVVTDPPYFDAIAYADLSDFFYVWLKRALGDVIPEVLITPLTPKNDEATALKHRHEGNTQEADKHFTTKLAQVLAEAKRVTKPDGIITVMFAHQSTKAWTALVSALFEAGLTIDATWPIDTELKNRSVALGASALESSITVACRPRITGSAASFKDVRKEIERVVQDAVKRFWSYGFRGADLIVACYGPAVGVFGKYERVEKADGTPVGIPKLLDLACQSARDAIAGEFRGDNLSTLYYIWANLYGASEQAWDDARLVVQIGGEAENAMEVARRHGIFVVDGSKCRLALLSDRAERRGLGVDQNPPFIDALHRSMLLWKEEKRRDLVSYLTERDLLEDGPFWKLVQPLFEVLPRDLEDWKLVNALLSERSTLRTEGKWLDYGGAQTDMFGKGQ